MEADLSGDTSGMMAGEDVEYSKKVKRKLERESGMIDRQHRENERKVSNAVAVRGRRT